MYQKNVLQILILKKIIDTSDEWIRTRTGIVERRFASKDQATSDLAREAALKAIENAKIKKRRCRYDNTLLQLHLII